MEQQVAGDVVAALAMNQRNPALVANHPAEPRDFIQAILHVSGEAPSLLG